MSGHEDRTASRSPGPSGPAQRHAITRHTRHPEADCLQELRNNLTSAPDMADPVRRGAICTAAASLVEQLRKPDAAQGGPFGHGSDFLHEFGLSSREGIALMCLAEALLRIPDQATADAMIADKIGSARWDQLAVSSDHLLLNASGRALSLTGRILREEDPDCPVSSLAASPARFLQRMVRKAGEPVIRTAIRQAMRLLGHQFVLADTISRALDRTLPLIKLNYRYSFDMLGEAARTEADARHYAESYQQAIHAIGRHASNKGEHGQTPGPVKAPGISVKLSALHPRFEYSQRHRCIPAILERLLPLAHSCKEYNIGLTLDAEESWRLDLTLDILETLALENSLAGWGGLGLAVQAYQRRAPAVLARVTDLARHSGRRLMVRLVKGAYWDSEIKYAQEQGFADFPVFTRKVNTDLSWLACARQLLEASDCLYPQFATHNAHSIMAVLAMARTAGIRGSAFEFQRLHGMGETLYEHALKQARDVNGAPVACRIYAPVGSHRELLPYLVRRLLENGANGSFVHGLHDQSLPAARLVRDPLSVVDSLNSKPHPRITPPPELFMPQRKNSAGFDFADPDALAALLPDLARACERPASAVPLTGEEKGSGPEKSCFSPADHRRETGFVIEADGRAVDRALTLACKAFPAWAARPVEERARCLETLADLLEEDRTGLLALAAVEAGKTLPEAVAELREAVDFCRYYAAMARELFAEPREMPGPTGELNLLSWHGRGVFACISPWNFPIAIFTGQIVAALVAGNCVLAKPADQTPLIAARIIDLTRKAGIPADVLHFLPGPGAVTGAAMVSDDRIAGVAFTGSTGTARAISRALVARNGPIAPLIAETGGQNAMIADSTALPEQIVDDLITSSFRCAGQRCSAVRVLFLQDDIASRVLDMLKGAMESLQPGLPWQPDTDIGPVIDETAREKILDHRQAMRTAGPVLAEMPLPRRLEDQGSFVAPCVLSLDRLDRLQEEIFGPVLHVIRYRHDHLDKVIDAINATGYGLTFGLHTRMEAMQHHVIRRIRAGNIYVNRNTVGAVVGSQPFGGEGLSGTGPKAGGPATLLRYATERCITVNQVAAGGNALLMAALDDLEDLPKA